MIDCRGPRGTRGTRVLVGGSVVRAAVCLTVRVPGVLGVLGVLRVLVGGSVVTAAV